MTSSVDKSNIHPDRLVKYEANACDGITRDANATKQQEQYIVKVAVAPLDLDVVTDVATDLAIVFW
jgi:hypothetical protein